MSLKGQRIALIGCGDIGIRLASLLDEADVHAMRRNTASLPQGLTAYSMDVTKPETLDVLRNTAFDYVVITLTPDRFSEETYQETYVNGLANILKALNTTKLKRLFWVSSTSVYGQDDDSWVDEQSPLQPKNFSGRMQLAAENLLAEISNATIVRFAGIYRSGTYRLLERIKDGELGDTIVPDPFSNRIHVDDCAGVMAHLIKRDNEGLGIERIYVASDNFPVRYSELLNWLAIESGYALQKGMVSEIARAGSKRCINKKLLESGYQFIYPDFKAGLQAAVAACRKK